MILQLLMNGVIAAGPIALVAVGLSLIYYVAKIIHLAHSTVITFTVYVAFVLIRANALPTLPSLALGLVAGTLMGVGIEVCIYRPLRDVSGGAQAAIIASLGFIVFGQNTLALLFSNQTYSLRSSELSTIYTLSGARVTGIQLLTLLISTAACFAVITWLGNTRFGSILRAIASDPELASAFGVRHNRFIIIVFALASCIGSIAGILTAYDAGLNPTMGFDVVLLGFTASIVGGIGSVKGAALGGLIIGCSQQFAGYYLPMWQDAIVFAILVLFLLARPQGLFGNPLRSVTV